MYELVGASGPERRRRRRVYGRVMTGRKRKREGGD
jgi:hypothetical protein